MNKTPVKDPSSHRIPTQFTFLAPAAQQVSVAGDFNNWDACAMPMHRGSHGIWKLSVSLTAGPHEYRFVADGTWYNDPKAGHKVTNALGTENCVVLVAAQGPSRPAAT